MTGPVHRGDDKLGTCLGPRTLRGLVFFGILQGSNRNIKIYNFAVVNYTEVQFGNSSWYNNYGEEPENVNHENIVDKFAPKIDSVKLVSNHNFILFIVIYVAFKYYV